MTPLELAQQEEESKNRPAWMQTPSKEKEEEDNRPAWMTSETLD